MRGVARAGAGDYCLVLTRENPWRSGYVPLPRQGPILTWRALASADDPPALGDWDLSLGDVELF
jgi:hypothetical protein